MSATSMRPKALRLAVAVLAVAGAACSLVRSLDGFSDEFGVSPDAADRDDARADAFVDDRANDQGDTAPLPRPRVSCTITPLAVFGPDAAPFTPEPMSGLTVADNYLYVTTGARSKLPDGGTVTDVGALVRVAKQGGARVIAERLESLAGCVTHPSQGAACAVGAQIVLFSSAGIASTLLETKERIVLDITPAADGTFIATQSAGLNGIWHVPWGREDASVRQPIASPKVVRADDDAGMVYVGRVAGPLSAYARAAWGTPDAAPWDAGDAALDGCPVFPDTSRALAVNSDGVFALAWDLHVYRDEKVCDASSNQQIGAPFYAIAADSRFVFVQRASEVELRWANDFTNTACAVALDAGIDASPGAETAAFDGDDVYFLAPPRVLKLHITLQP